LALGLNEGPNPGYHRRYNDEGGDVPTTWWAAVWKLTDRHGLWAALCCFLIYITVWQVVPALAKQHDDHTRLQNYLEALCLNAAVTEIQFSRCNAASIVKP
jgi:uncharacterized membrane protein YhdT